MKNRQRKQIREFGLLFMRAGLGIMFIFHGYPKLFGGPETWERLGANMSNFGIHFAPAFWGFMAAFAEFFGGILLIFGLLFTPALILLILTMTVATVSYIADGQGIMGASHPLKVGIVFVGLLFTGPGKLSLDSLLFYKNKRSINRRA